MLNQSCLLYEFDNTIEYLINFYFSVVVTILTWFEFSHKWMSHYSQKNSNDHN